MVDIVDIREEHVEGFRETLDAVSREKRYLAWTEAPPLESTRAFVLGNIMQGIPQVVALDGKRIVGWCDVSPHGRPTMKHCGTLGMGVLKSYRHRGIGTRLITAALNRAKRLGLEKVELEVFDSNRPAIELYEKIGFSREGIRIASVRIDGVDFNTVQMALFLKDFPRGTR